MDGSAVAGGCVFVPPQVPHAFANRRESRARFLLIMSPAGHDRYFDELAGILATDGPPDSGAIAALRDRYDTQQLSSLVTDAQPQPEPAERGAASGRRTP